MIFRTLPSFATGLRSLRNRFRKGVTAIEFTLLAPIYFLMFIGLVELSLIMLVQHVLESSTFNASRLAKTGYVEGGRTQLETVMDVIDREMGSLSPLIQVSKLTFTSTVYDNLNDLGVDGKGRAGLGGASQVVVFTITYPWKVFTPMIGNIIADQDGILQLSSRIVVRNEPYNN